MVGKVLVIGGTGMIGKKLCDTLQNYKIPYDSLARSDSATIKGSILDKELLQKIIPNYPVVVNLVGLSPITFYPDYVYHQIHVEGVRNIISVIRQCDSQPRFVQISALGIDSDQVVTAYNSSKLDAEALITKNLENYIIIRPALVLDQHSETFSLLERFKILKLICVPQFTNKMQPVISDDLVEVIANAAQSKSNQIIEVAGKEVLGINEIWNSYFYQTGYIVVKIPGFMAKLGINLLKLLPVKLFSNSLLKMLSFDNISSKNQISSYCENPSGYSDWLRSLN